LLVLAFLAWLWGCAASRASCILADRQRPFEARGQEVQRGLLGVHTVAPSSISACLLEDEKQKREVRPVEARGKSRIKHISTPPG
jgi:hypothetical protein